MSQICICPQMKNETSSEGLWRLQIVFAYASGHLAWSILAFRNSLVFHSLDKVNCLARENSIRITAWGLHPRTLITRFMWAEAA